MPLPRGSPRERSAGASSCQDPSTHRSAPGVFLDSVTDRSWWIESNDFATTANSVASAKTTPTRLSWPTLFTHYLEGDEDECSRQGAAGACGLMRIVSGQSRTAPVRRRSGDVLGKASDSPHRCTNLADSEELLDVLSVAREHGVARLHYQTDVTVDHVSRFAERQDLADRPSCGSIKCCSVNASQYTRQVRLE